MLVWLRVLQVAGCPILHLQASESLPPLIMTCNPSWEAHNLSLRQRAHLLVFLFRDSEIFKQ